MEELKRELQAIVLAMNAASSTGTILFNDDRKLDGEALNNPKYRVAAFQQDRHTSVVNCLRDARWRYFQMEGAAALQHGELVACLDGGKLGCHLGLTDPWRTPVVAADDAEADAKTNLEKEKKLTMSEHLDDSGKAHVRFSKIQLVKDEDSIRETKTARNMASVNQNEVLLLGRLSSTTVPERPGQELKGYEQGDSHGRHLNATS